MSSKLAQIALLMLVISFTCMHKQDLSFRRNIDFNHDWKFMRIDSSGPNTGQEFQIETILDSPDSGWQQVILPHTPRLEPLVVNDQWQGICWYRKHFNLDPVYSEKKIFIEFEGAMQVADIWLNEKHLIRHEGGYLPFSIDITDVVRFDRENVLVVKLDNRDNPEVPPGKPLKQLDFCMYGGIYRNVKLHILEPIHISDAVASNRPGGGGIFVRYENVSKTSADILIQTHVVNTSHRIAWVQVISRILDEKGIQVAGEIKTPLVLSAGSDQHIMQKATVSRPILWSPDKPYLYTLKSQIVNNNQIIDELDTRIGIRTISFSADSGFQINGERRYLRGTNQHQEYPYIGYALSDKAQYRDAYKIKAAGFDYIRLSHYPHAIAFMAACDELGLVVMDCIPGWQFMGGEKFKELCYQNCRDMIRRDRNHPAVVLWEVSLNETAMDSVFLARTQRIAHEEYPGSQCYTCGWTDQQYDVFIQARQHGGCKGYRDGDKACLISEYGDWEYYAQNAGLDQPGFRDLKAEERNSRQLRAAGEKRMLQQAMNFQEAHNDNRSTRAVGDGLWVMYDYNRGYDNTLEASGVMDIFRLPKFSYYFFQSQRDVDQTSANGLAVPMVYIANYWNENTLNSAREVRVFSNCEKIKLYLNDQLLAVQDADTGRFTNNLTYPPFTFKIDRFTPGKLQAVGMIGEKELAEHTINTPGKPQQIEISFDLGGKKISADGADVIFVYAKIVDASGTVVPNITIPVEFNLKGSAELLGSNPINAEGGIATILLRAGLSPGIIEVTCTAEYEDHQLSGRASIAIN